MKRKTNPLILAINESTSKARREGHELINKAQALEAKRMKIRVNYSEAFKDLNLEVHNLYIRTSFYKPYIEVNLNDLESFKDQQLVDLLEFFTSKTDKVTTTDWTHRAVNRDYSFELDDVVVNICAYVRSDSPTCRRVQTGTEVQEVPQYKIVCD
jgi:hypothetical protein